MTWPSKLSLTGEFRCLQIITGQKREAGLGFVGLKSEENHEGKGRKVQRGDAVG